MKVRPKITWLISIFILILVIVVVGGITRLTNSGLSMVEWRLLYGFLPPLNHEEWVRVFDLYKQTPEFFHYNHTMDLHGFKQIFFLGISASCSGTCYRLNYYFRWRYFSFQKTI